MSLVFKFPRSEVLCYGMYTISKRHRIQLQNQLLQQHLLSQPLCSDAHLIASRLPCLTLIPNQMASDAVVHNANKKGKPCQLLPVLLMIAWITFGPTMDEARFESP